MKFSSIYSKSTEDISGVFHKPKKQSSICSTRKIGLGLISIIVFINSLIIITLLFKSVLLQSRSNYFLEKISKAYFEVTVKPTTQSSTSQTPPFNISTAFPSSLQPPTFLPSSTPNSTVFPSSTPDSTVFPSSTPDSTVLPSSTPDSTVLPSSTPDSTVFPSSTPDSTVLPSSTPDSTVLPSSTPESTVFPSSTPDSTDLPSSTPPSSSSIRTTVTLISVETSTSTIQSSSSTDATTSSPKRENAVTVLNNLKGIKTRDYNCYKQYTSCSPVTVYQSNLSVHFQSKPEKPEVVLNFTAYFSGSPDVKDAKKKVAYFALEQIAPEKLPFTIKPSDMDRKDPECVVGTQLPPKTKC